MNDADPHSDVQSLKELVRYRLCVGQSKDTPRRIETKWLQYNAHGARKSDIHRRHTQTKSHRSDETIELFTLTGAPYITTPDRPTQHDFAYYRTILVVR